jgi:uncharacterized ion transporter superfamily protein YfcC
MIVRNDVKLFLLLFLLTYFVISTVRSITYLFTYFIKFINENHGFVYYRKFEEKKENFNYPLFSLRKRG